MSQLLKKCKTPHCRNLHSNRNGLCDECSAREASVRRFSRLMHGTEYERADRASAAERGYDAAWHKYAREYLRTHNKCAICGKPAQVVDHKEIPAPVMLKAFGKFILDDRMYQPLCFSCNRKKAKQDAEYIADYMAGLKRLEPIGEVKMYEI